MGKDRFPKKIQTKIKNPEICKKGKLKSIIRPSPSKETGFLCLVRAYKV